MTALEVQLQQLAQRAQPLPTTPDGVVAEVQAGHALHSSQHCGQLGEDAAKEDQLPQLQQRTQPLPATLNGVQAEVQAGQTLQARQRSGNLSETRFVQV